jgi:hypothetical protein
MESARNQRALDGAYDEIHASILPSASLLLDSLLDAAMLALPGVDAALHADELRSLAVQIDDLARRVASLAPIHEPARLSMSA